MYCLNKIRFSSTCSPHLVLDARGQGLIILLKRRNQFEGIIFSISNHPAGNCLIAKRPKKRGTGRRIPLKQWNSAFAICSPKTVPSVELLALWKKSAGIMRTNLFLWDKSLVHWQRPSEVRSGSKLRHLSQQHSSLSSRAWLFASSFWFMCPSSVSPKKLCSRANKWWGLHFPGWPHGRPLFRGYDIITKCARKQDRRDRYRTDWVLSIPLWHDLQVFQRKWTCRQRHLNSNIQLWWKPRGYPSMFGCGWWPYR